MPTKFLINCNLNINNLHTWRFNLLSERIDPGCSLELKYLPKLSSKYYIEYTSLGPTHANEK
jgi:hypothetical protein